MSSDSSIRIGYLDALGIDPDEVMGKSNMVKLDDDIALRLAIMDARTPGRTTKRSLVEEAVESYYDQYFGRLNDESESDLITLDPQRDPETGIVDDEAVAALDREDPDDLTRFL